MIDDHGKYLYFPYAICLWSSVSKIESFKLLMYEMYKIITYQNSGFSEECIRDFRNSELLHLFLFTSNIIKPPSYSKLSLTLRKYTNNLLDQSNVDFNFHSKYEIPCQEYNVKVLFDCLEVSVIIKLWYSLLSEKHIIILANQNHLLFSICEGMLSLIFPFKWLHTYIPVLPKNQIDYLESPTPYIMGVLSSYVDFQYLRETYPNHIICDANTSMIYGSAGCSLPVMEEITLRKKLQFIKNPGIYNIEDIGDIFGEGSNDFNIEDISTKRTFSENVQYIFFSIIKTVLIKVQLQCLEDGVFDSQKFLEEITNEELRDCWEKIINTVGFEYFILSYQYLDDSNTKIFSNICKYDEEKLINKQGLFKWKLNLPNSVTFFNELEFKAKSLENIKHKKLDKYIENLKTYSSHYNQVLSGELQKNSLNLGLVKKAGVVSQKGAKRNTFSYDFTTANKILLDNSQSDINYSQKRSIIVLNNMINIETTQENRKQLFKVYGKKGFLSFVTELFDILNTKDIMDLGYHQDILKEINKQMHDKFKQTKELTTFLKIIEQESEYEYEDNSEFNSPRYTYDKMTNAIIELPKVDCFQYYLIEAYYLCEYSDSRDMVFELYKKAVDLDKDSFPCIRFYQYIDEYNETSKLRYFINNTNSDLIGKVLAYKLKKLGKSKTVNFAEIQIKKDKYTFEDSKQVLEEIADSEVVVQETMLRKKSSKKLNPLSNTLGEGRMSTFKKELDQRRSFMGDNIETIV
jgi:hypothetical protein